jgi:hypothetical protein
VNAGGHPDALSVDGQRHERRRRQAAPQSINDIVMDDP